MGVRFIRCFYSHSSLGSDTRHLAYWASRYNRLEFPLPASASSEGAISKLFIIIKSFLFRNFLYVSINPHGDGSLRSQKSVQRLFRLSRIQNVRGQA
jgi:hypothetical protein